MNRTPTPIRPPRAFADWSDSDSERGDAAAAAAALPPADAAATTLIRFKRKRDDDPIDSLVVSKSIRSDDGPPQQLLFTLAYTAPTNTAPPVVPQRNGARQPLNLEPWTEGLKSRRSQRRDEHLERGKSARLRLVSRNRMIDSDGVGVQVVDIEREDDRSQNHVANTEDSMASKDDFVFDVYAFEGPTNSSTSAKSSDALYLDFSDLVFDEGNDEDGPLDEADEDSNDEDDYRNDYPEEEAEDGEDDYGIDYGSDY
ncbi:hypothetical protein DFJ73DRAFT_763931 [Zopfochytrium polystomum]|nr:hypothetical protein DFJ73DRAFT_763931 [Zopfochytrium polystomum]